MSSSLLQTFKLPPPAQYLFLLSSEEHELGAAPPAAIQVNNDWLESILRIWLEPIKGKVGKGVQGNGASCRELCKRTKLMSFLPVPASWSAARNLGFFGGPVQDGPPPHTGHPSSLRDTVPYGRRNKAGTIVAALVHRHITLTSRPGVRG